MSTLRIRRRRAAARAHDTGGALGATIRTAGDVVGQFQALTLAEQEEIWVLGLNARHRVISLSCAAIGTVDHVAVSGRDVFRELVRRNALCFILCHNHPSGEPSPSLHDEALTMRLSQAGALLSIILLDHIIIAKEGHFSFADQGLIVPIRRR